MKAAAAVRSSTVQSGAVLEPGGPDPADEPSAAGLVSSAVEAVPALLALLSGSHRVLARITTASAAAPLRRIDTTTLPSDCSATSARQGVEGVKRETNRVASWDRMPSGIRLSASWGSVLTSVCCVT